MSRDADYALDMLNAARQVTGYTRGVSESAFQQQPLIQDAVLRQLMVLGEAAGRLTKPFCTAHPAIPWSKIKGLRNRLIHDYGNVDVEIVWKVVQEELPGLIAQLEALVPRSPKESR